MILIKNVEMPTNCYKCPMRRRDGMDLVCPIAHERFSVADVNILEYRHKNCPLVPVPPHGRLIDEAVLWVEINKICDRRDAGIITDLTCLQQLLSAVRHAPTVIEAEEGKRDRH